MPNQLDCDENDHTSRSSDFVVLNYMSMYKFPDVNKQMMQVSENDAKVTDHVVVFWYHQKRQMAATL